MMKLSQFFSGDCVLRDAFFSQVDEADTAIKGSLVYCLNAKFLGRAISNDNVSCIITTPELSHDVVKKGLVATANPRVAFFQLYNRLSDEGLNKPHMDFGIGRSCLIHPSAVLSDKVKIGNDVVIGANTVIESYTCIGNNSYIGSNVTIGAEGLVTVEENGGCLFIRHAGGVEIGSHVMILSNAVIAKSLFQSFTRIGDNSQIGILSNIGHGAKLGRNCVISGNCLVAGRTVFGDHVWMGASSSVAQGLRVGRNAQIKIGSVVIRDVQDNEVVSGNFAIAHARNMKRYLRAGHE
jgi:UDP-3-O-[3-hydroxymyristoyl] glucosamine N-acyltransferase